MDPLRSRDKRKYENYHVYFSEKILQGDENAARLIGTPLETIYPLTQTSENVPQKMIPTRIRFKYYLYEFADDRRSLFATIKSTIQKVASK